MLFKLSIIFMIVKLFKFSNKMVIPPKKIGKFLDGRDITSVINENAMFKFFLTANLKTRALRTI